MTSTDAVVACVDALDACGISYMRVGSLSLKLYAPPRSTQDADFLVQLEDDQLDAMMRALGPAFRLDPQVTSETVTATTRHNIVTDQFEIELFPLSDDPFDQERFARRRQINMLGRAVFVATAADVVAMKLRWSRQGGRSKDIDDVRNLVAAQRSTLDWDYIHHWTDTHQTGDLLDQVVDSLPQE